MFMWVSANSVCKDDSYKVMFGLKKREERKRVEWREREKKEIEKSSEIKFCCLI